MAAGTSEHPLMRLPLGEHMGIAQLSEPYICPGYPAWMESVPENRGLPCKFTLIGPPSQYCLYCRRRVGLSSIVIMSYLLPPAAVGGRLVMPLEDVDADMAAAMVATIRRQHEE